MSSSPSTQGLLAQTVPTTLSWKSLSINPFDNIPNEIILMIADLLEPWDVNSLIQTSHFFSNLLDSRLYALATTYRFSDEGWGNVSVIEWASIYGKENVMKKLIEAGADIGVVDHDGWGLLHNAAEFGHGTIARMLLDAGIDPAAKRNDGGTALHLAVSNSDETLVRAILAAGCDPDIRGDQGSTALYTCANWNCVGIARILLEAGADVLSRSKDRHTPLHLAAEKGLLTLVEVLLAAGADPNAVDCYGVVPLHWAVHGGYFPVVKTLLPLTQDLDVKDGVTGSALHLALRTGRRDVIELLLPAGTDPLQLDGYGMSCMDRATVRPDIFELLKSYCRGQYQPADVAKIFTTTRKTIANIAQSMHDELLTVHDPRSFELSRCLTFVDDIPEACTAIAFASAALFNGNWACEVCKGPRQYECSICEKNIDGDSYFCRKCPDSYICSSCYASSEGRPEVRLCRGHEFVCISMPPTETYLFEEEDVVNSRGESRVQWLARLVNTYSSMQQ